MKNVQSKRWMTINISCLIVPVILHFKKQLTSYYSHLTSLFSLFSPPFEIFPIFWYSYAAVLTLIYAHFEKCKLANTIFPHTPGFFRFEPIWSLRQVHHKNNLNLKTWMLNYKSSRSFSWSLSWIKGQCLNSNDPLCYKELAKNCNSYLFNWLNFD